MNTDGTMKPFFGERHENLNNLTRRLKEVTSRRHNFIVIGFKYLTILIASNLGT